MRIIRYAMHKTAFLPSGRKAALHATCIGLFLLSPSQGRAADAASPSTGGDTAVLAPLQIEGDSTGDSETYAAKKSSSATKTDTPLIETPQAINVVTRAEMDQRGADTVSEALRYTPGVSVETYGVDARGMDWITIRGFSSWDGSSLDGMRLFNYGFYEVYGLDRIEVLKGPSSVLYGQSVPGGMVNRVSKLPSDEPSHEVNLEAGNFDHYQGSLDVTGPLTDDGRLTYRLTALGRDSGTQAEYGSTGDRVQDDRLFVAPSLTWKMDPDTDLTLQFSYLHQDGGTAWYVRDANGNDSGLVASDPNWNSNIYKQIFAGYQFTHRFTDNLQFRQKARYGTVDNTYKVLYGYYGLMADGHTAYRAARYALTSAKTFNMDNQIEGKVETGGVAHTLLLGTDFASNDLDESAKQNFLSDDLGLDLDNPVYGISVPTPTSTRYDDSEKDKLYGIYAQDQMHIGPSLVLTLGGRHDWVKTDITDHTTNTSTSQKDSAFSGRAGVSYYLTREIAPYVSYSQSFEPNSGTDRNGQHFDPTRGTQFEVGTKFEPASLDASFTFSLFHLIQKNVLTTDPVDTSYSVQTGEMRSQGVELEGKGNLSEELSGVASFSYTDVEVTKSNDGTVGKRPALVPAVQAALWADYTFHSGPLANFGLGGGLRYIGNQYGDSANTMKADARILVDTSLHYDLGALSFSLSATNLFDKEQVVEDGYNYYHGAERTVRFKTTYRW